MAVPWPQVVLFGDSLIQGATQTLGGFSFQSALEEHCSRRFDVVNRGLSGYNSSQALKALPQIFTPPKEGGPQLKYLLVLLGANDACIPPNDQHVPLDQFKQNITSIVTHPAVTAHKPKILLVTAPPLDEILVTKLDLAWGHAAATRRAKVSAAYSEAVRQVAAEHPDTTELVDLWKAVMDHAIAKTPGFDPVKAGGVLGDPASGQRGYLEHLLPDGLHLSGESYQVFFDLVKARIGSEWAGFPEEDRVGYVLPEWKTAPRLED